MRAWMAVATTTATVPNLRILILRTRVSIARPFFLCRYVPDFGLNTSRQRSALHRPSSRPRPGAWSSFRAALAASIISHRFYSR